MAEADRVFDLDVDDLGATALEVKPPPPPQAQEEKNNSITSEVPLAAGDEPQGLSASVRDRGSTFEMWDRSS